MLSRKLAALALTTWSVHAHADSQLGLLSTSGVIVRTGSEDTLIQSLGVSYAATDSLSLSLRYGAVQHSGGAQPAGMGFGNLVLSGTFTRPIGEHVQVNAGLSLTIPTNAIGSGPMEDGQYAAEMSAIDWFGTMFLPNYFDLAPGAGISLTVGRFTGHLEVDVHEVIRARAERVDAYDAAATALAPDLSLTYRVAAPLSLFAHVTEIRLLTTPSAVEADPSSRTEHFLSGGASLEVEIGRARTLTGTLTYAVPVDGPLVSQGYQAVALDLALSL